MDIPVKAEVQCVDGACGHASYVVIDQANQRVTHLVVEAQVYPRLERLAGIDLIQETTPKAIKLRITREEFAGLPEFTQVDFQSRGEIWRGYVPGEALFSPGAPGAVGDVPLEHENLPAGQFALRVGIPVAATDGEAGHLADLVLDPADNHLTHLVIQHGGLFRSRRITVSADQIATIGDDAIYLKLDRQSLETLPEA